MTKKLWFRAKRYGWGWAPCSLEGWLCIVAYTIFLVWNFLRLDKVSHSNSDTLRPFVIQMLLATVILIVIAYYKGEKPGWRWRDKK
jgi:hypothetical protein